MSQELRTWTVNLEIEVTASARAAAMAAAARALRAAVKCPTELAKILNELQPEPYEDAGSAGGELHGLN